MVRTWFLFVLCFFCIKLVVLLDPARGRASASGLHTVCLSHTPSSRYAALYAAIVCGKPPTTLPEALTSLRSAGLIHFIVVSGAHLLFVSQIIGFLLQKILFWTSQSFASSVKFACLASFVAMTNFQIPVVRAFLLQSLGSTFGANSRFLSPSVQVALTGLATICLFSTKTSLSSLWLSWAASLVLVFPFKNSSLLKRQCFLFTVMTPLLLQYTTPHPISIVFNLILGPVLSLILLPVCLLSFLLPPFTFVGDWLWSVLILICSMGPESGPQSTSYNLPGLFCFSYLATLHLIAYYLEVQYRKRVILEQSGS